MSRSKSSKSKRAENAAHARDAKASKVSTTKRGRGKNPKSAPKVKLPKALMKGRGKKSVRLAALEHLGPAQRVEKNITNDDQDELNAVSDDESHQSGAHTPTQTVGFRMRFHNFWVQN